MVWVAPEAVWDPLTSASARSGPRVQIVYTLNQGLNPVKCNIRPGLLGFPEDQWKELSLRFSRQVELGHLSSDACPMYGAEGFSWRL